MFSLSSRFTTGRFQIEQAFGMCAVYYDDCPYAPIADEAAGLDLDEVEPPLVLVATAPAVGAVGHRLGLAPNPRLLEAATTHIATEIVNGARRAAPAMREETNLQEATDACFRSPLLSLTGLVRTPGGRSSHPCQWMPVYFPGPNLGPAYGLRRDALDNNRVLHLQNYLHEDMRTDGLPRDWFDNEPECVDRGSDPCDEFPSYSTVQAGRLAPPFAVLEAMSPFWNEREGGFWGSFVRVGRPGCGLAHREPLAVVAMPEDGPPVTGHICPPGRGT